MLSEPEPSGSKELCGDLIKSKPRIGMRSKTEKKSCPYPKIADSTNYTYDSDEFQFDIDDVEKKFSFSKVEKSCK